MRARSLPSISLAAWAMLIFVGCLIARVIFVSLFASEIPLWDQWDAEADYLLRPLMTHELTFLDLFKPHNEHRIFFTRILALGLFELNSGQWSNLLETYANSVLFAAIPAIFFYFSAKDASSYTEKVGALLGVCVVATLPFGYENALGGFQSQFFFMTAFALVMLASVVFSKPNVRNYVFLIFLGFASLFTMASGLIGCVATAATALMAWYAGKATFRRSAYLAFAMVGLAVFGMTILTNVPGHASLRAVGLRDHVNALTTVLMWPMQPLTGRPWRLDTKALYALVMWSPFIICIAVFIRTRVASRSLLFVTGVAGWVLLQAVAIAHSRGHDMSTLASRYMDIAAIGLVCNLWLAGHLLAIGKRTWAPWGAVVVLLAFAAFGLYRRLPNDLGAARAWRASAAVQTDNVAAYVRTGDPSHLDQPYFHIPYPDAKRLSLLLDNPTIRAMLPPSIGPSLPSLHGTLGQEEANLSDASTLRLVSNNEIFSTYALQDRMGRIALRCPSPVSGPVSLVVVSTSDRVPVVVQPGMPCDGLLYVRTPAAPFRIEAADPASAQWLVESQPSQTASGTYAAQALRHRIDQIVGVRSTQ